MPAIKEIDRVLVGQYGLTAEEVDHRWSGTGFIINYDTCPVFTGSSTAPWNGVNLGLGGGEEGEE